MEAISVSELKAGLLEKLKENRDSVEGRWKEYEEKYVKKYGEKPRAKEWTEYLTPWPIDACYYSQKSEITLMGRIYCRLLTSLQNRQGRSDNSIRFTKPIDKEKRSELTHAFLKDVFVNYEPKKICDRYDTAKALYNAIKAKFEQEKLNMAGNWVESKSEGKEDGKKFSPWQEFCIGAFDAAKYLAKFIPKGEQKDEGEAFLAYAGVFASTPELRDLLPNEMARNIQYIGYTLACDFLKELSYTQDLSKPYANPFSFYGKADVHLMRACGEILENFGKKKIESHGEKKPKKRKKAEMPKASEIATIQLIRLAAEAVKDNRDEFPDISATPYAIDKIFWLANATSKKDSHYDDIFYDRSFGAGA